MDRKLNPSILYLVRILQRPGVIHIFSSRLCFIGCYIRRLEIQYCWVLWLSVQPQKALGFWNIIAIVCLPKCNTDRQQGFIWRFLADWSACWIDFTAARERTEGSHHAKDVWTWTSVRQSTLVLNCCWFTGSWYCWVNSIRVIIKQWFHFSNGRHRTVFDCFEYKLKFWWRVWLGLKYWKKRLNDYLQVSRGEQWFDFGDGYQLNKNHLHQLQLIVTEISSESEFTDGGFWALLYE